MSIFKRHKWPAKGGHTTAFFRPMALATSREAERLAQAHSTGPSVIAQNSTATLANGQNVVIHKKRSASYGTADNDESLEGDE
jgi:hypothetical protein